MEPLSSYFATPQRKRILVLATFLVIIGGIFLAYKSLLFHVVRTDPDMSSVSTITPYIQLQFNEPLSTSGLIVNDPGNILASKEVKDKSLTLTFKQNLSLGQEYSLTVVQVMSEDGDVIRNERLEFQVKNISYEDMSESQKKALIDRQDTYPYEVDYINFTGFSALSDNGMSSSQLQSLKTLLHDYSLSVKKEYRSMTIPKESIETTIHDRTSEDGLDTQAFKITLDKKLFTASVRYGALDDNVQLQLTDSSGVVVYDTAHVD